MRRAADPTQIAALHVSKHHFENGAAKVQLYFELAKSGVAALPHEVATLPRWGSYIAPWGNYKYKV